MRNLRGLRRPGRFENSDCNCCVISSMPAGLINSIVGIGIDSSISISLSSRSPSRSFLRNFCRVAESADSPESLVKPTLRGGGSSASSTRSSAASSARWRNFAVSCSRVCLTAISARSRMIVSTSRPT